MLARTGRGRPSAGEEGARREGLVMVQRVKFDDAFHVAVVNDRLYFDRRSTIGVLPASGHGGQDGASARAARCAWPPR